jgi:hypothetical protein
MGARRDLARRRAKSARRTCGAPRKSQTGKIAKSGSEPAADLSARCRTPFDRRRVPRGGSGLDWISERPRQHAIRLRKSQKSSADCCHTGHGRDRRHWRCLVCCRSRVWPEVKPSIHFIETGDRAERRVASRLRDSRSSNPCRHSWLKIRRDARGDRSSYRASIAVAHVANTSLATTLVGEGVLHVASDVF